ncbi:S8 family serine peptidase [Pedobacter borealis]|uniref:S8 family serine peptidase n=1 Tax=Pedobacter borealis TaxID=475254 RepID=UPI0006EB9B52|nr:S8 family serine peptidase [Pedobacter borealis]
MWQRAAKMARRFASKSQATTKDSEMYNSKPKNHRDEVVRDNYNDINDSNYGNGDVTATDPMHGTHVSGIIGAQQNNNLGVNGVADNVQIMVLRAVPDGDEYDKDIALAIRYAVDNGTRVINMSFGKFYSPGKKWVDDAVKYAQKKDVLLVHAAGNDSKNIDKEFNYPSPVSKDSLFTASNWITVGASGMSGSGIAAPFSNYGKQSVDVFAPGVRIYSTLPKANKYGFLDGTSMAAPVVAGLAALIREYFPALSATQVKYVIEQSVLKPEELVNIPGRNEKVPLSNLCRTGGIVNALGAVELAFSLKGELKKRAVKKKILKKARS